MREKRIIGITGGIGSGKSEVAKLFGEMGAKVLDADNMISALHDSPELKAAISARFGKEMYRADGSLDRKKMADKVFSNKEEVKALEQILHPPLIAKIQAEVKGAGRYVIDAALLIESGLDRICDAIIFVEADEEVRTKRLESGRNWSFAEARRREAHQINIEEKRKLADFVVDNNGDLTTTRKQVEQVAQHLHWR